MPASAATRALLAEYGRHHRHPANVVLHAAGVPLLLVSLVGLAWGVPVPAVCQAAVPWFNWALVAVAALSAHAFRLSLALGAGVLLLLALGYAGLALAEAADLWPTWKFSTLGFAVAVTLQFIGHQLERNHPVCFRRPALGLLGASWLVSRVYDRIGHPY
jgi:uncharacterized membrane protein YGL010W